MARFLKNHGITDAIEDLIRNANRRLVLISPYLQLSDSIKRTLEAKLCDGLGVQMVYHNDKRRPEDINRLLKFALMPSASKPFFGSVGLLEARSGLKNPF